MLVESLATGVRRRRPRLGERRCELQVLQQAGLADRHDHRQSATLVRHRDAHLDQLGLARCGHPALGAGSLIGVPTVEIAPILES
ncbi:hypothetical protein [Thermocatellispora tengchongensis]|uniref:hypothetical protein n=1 Tax=Thermocatellispora tengchongensis TaxID=1073253 RepID=UPI00362D1D38